MSPTFYRCAAVAAFLLTTYSLHAQSVESYPFRAILSPLNEVPPIANLEASGAGTVWLHVVRDASGEIVSGSVDFTVSYRFPSVVTITGMHIHTAAAGVNGPVTIDSAITRTEDVTAGFLPTLQAQIGSSSSAATMAAFKGILEDPSGYYLNVHTSANPGGAIRGQLMRAERAVRVAVLSPANEVPPIAGLEASGRGTAVILKTLDSNGFTNSASIIFDVNYIGFPAETVITGMHLHAGAAGTNGPVTIDAVVSTPVTVAATGGGALRYEAEIDLNRARAQETLDNVFYNPAQVYMNVHTRANPGGAIRGQLLSTDEMNFQVNMSPANEVPPVNLEVNAPAKVSLFTARGPEGVPVAGAIIFDVNARFGAAPATNFTAMHVHDGVAGANGPVTLDARFAQSATLTREGVGNIYKLNSLPATAMASLGSAVTNPERHYANLHSSANPGGVVRAQLADANTATPVIGDIIAGASEPTIANIAPGGIASLFGANFTKVATNLNGVNGPRVPLALNGTSVTIGGKGAPVLLVTPDQLNVQVPFDAPTGMQPVVVTSANGASNTRMHMVAPVAPALLFDATGGLAYKVSDMSLIRPDNAATAGDLVAILTTGMGVTAPLAPTGMILPPDPLIPVVVQPTVTVGGRVAPVVGAAAAPGFIGLYGIVFSVPPGLTAGDQAVVARQGTVSSNSVNIAIR